MPQVHCFETICFENHQFRNLEYHQARLDRTRLNLYGLQPDWKLADIIQIPDTLQNIKYKCRVSYFEKPEKIEWSAYIPRQISKIRKVYHDDIDYTFKYENRDDLNALYAEKQDADEILIIRKGMITDSAFGNVALFDGKKWYTPSTPLLIGTQRSFLLYSGIIFEEEIRESDLSKFSHIRLFNAMIPWDIAPELAITSIR